MAHVSGPTSSMPLSSRAVPEEMECDFAGDEICSKGTRATVRLQGETDSFGAEYSDVCQAHADSIRTSELNTPTSCDWCKKMSNNCRSTRDYDEGMSGPVYMVCPACRLKQSQDADEEVEYWRSRNLQGDYFEYDPWYGDE